MSKKLPLFKMRGVKAEKGADFKCNNAIVKNQPIKKF